MANSESRPQPDRECGCTVIGHCDICAPSPRKGRKGWRVTYDIVTPESAQNGEAEEQGYVLPGGCHVPTDQTLPDADGDYSFSSLKEALKYVEPSEDSGRWFSEHGERLNYQTGAGETRELHPPESITAASYARVRRALRITSGKAVR